jgi:hypothetical protein
MGLNAEARGALFVIADTGLRLSEALNLNETTIHLDGDIPYIEVLPDGRRVKTQDSIRTIPLVGTALAAMKQHPKGFPRYIDKGASFSAYVNGYLLDRGLRPTRKHTVYSLRHSFKDRLIAAKCQDSMIEALMGHADDHPKYGSGPSLDLKFEVLHAIAFTPGRPVGFQRRSPPTSMGLVFGIERIGAALAAVNGSSARWHWRCFWITMRRRYADTKTAIDQTRR